MEKNFGLFAYVKGPDLAGRSQGRCWRGDVGSCPEEENPGREKNLHDGKGRAVILAGCWPPTLKAGDNLGK